MDFKKVVNHLLHLVWPTKCVSCHSIIEPSQLFCPECFNSIKLIDFDVCVACYNKKQYCDCHKNPRWYKRSCAPFIYSNAIQNALIYLKKQKSNELISFLANEMAKEFNKKYKAINFDCIIPVPMHKTNYNKRGYNQSELIAQRLSQIIGVPVNSHVVTQKYKSKTQHSLDYKSRKKNVKGIYFSLPSEYNNILLIDDIISTGFTLNECAKTLKLSGVNEVYALAGAKNYPDEGKRKMPQPKG